MVNQKIIQQFYDFRNEIIKRIYLQQAIEWNFIISNNNSSFDDDLYNELEREIITIEQSPQLIDAISNILSQKNIYDKNLEYEAEIVLDRITQRKNKEGFEDFTRAKINCQKKYLLAKQENDFNAVKKSLGDLVKIKREISNNSYQMVLQEKVKDVSFREVDKLFSKISDSSLLLLNHNETIAKSCIVNEDAQNIVNYLLELMNINSKNITLIQSSESFMMSFGSKDVRVGLNKKERDLVSFLKYAAHEFGHLLYEQRNNECFDNTFLSGGSSTTFHEGMAYFFEHYLAESNLFQKLIIKKYNLKFKEEFSSVTPIRIKSCNAQYPLHILVRYELEKALINGSLKVDDLNFAWKEMYKKHLRILPNSDQDGILQDPHWFNGQFGYFPAYIIGRTYASQLYKTINKIYDFEKCINDENLKKPIDWLTENVYQFGSSKKPKQILLNSTGCEFSSDDYLDDILSK